MTEKELINKIRKLNEIRPSKDWVVLTKNNILGEEKVSLREKFLSQKDHLREVFSFKRGFAFVIASSLLFFFALFAFAQNSLPGSFLFPLKRVTEKAQAMLIPQQKQIDYNVAIAEKRLEELRKIAENNSVENLAPAINEYQASVSQIAQDLAKTKNKKEVKDIAEKVQKLKKQELKIESSASLVVPKNKELEKASAGKLVSLLNSLVRDLKKNQSLTEAQKIALKKVEENIKKKEYNEALIMILTPPLNTISGK